MTPQQQQAFMPREVPATLKLYLAGKLEQYWIRADGKGVFFLLEVNTLEEAQHLFNALPLAEGKLMQYEFLPVGPLSPLGLLLPAA